MGCLVLLIPHHLFREAPREEGGEHEDGADSGGGFEGHRCITPFVFLTSSSTSASKQDMHLCAWGACTFGPQVHFAFAALDIASSEQLHGPR